MIAGSEAVPRGKLLGFLSGIAALLSLVLVGCGSSEEAVDELDSTPAISPSARMEYRVDSLMNENRRLHDQAEAVSAENRRLTAKNAELETRVTEALAAPKVAPATAPSRPSQSAASSKVVQSGEASSAYSAALDQFKSRNYAAAAEGFQAILNSGADPGLADNCTYWIGESNYGMGKYNDAMKQFESVMATKRSGKKPDALFMMGNCQAALGNTIAARETYQKVINAFPTSWLVDKAKDRLAKLK